MADQSPLFAVLNAHSGSTAPIVDPQRSYVGYYMDRYGEQWLYVHSYGFDEDLLYVGDCDWKPFRVVADGMITPEFRHIVDDVAVRRWVNSCWIAADPERARLSGTVLEPGKIRLLR